MSKIKLVEKDTDLSNICHKVDWDIVFCGTPMTVYRIDNYYHSLGGKMGDNNYWCCPANEEPCYENLVEFSGDVTIFGIHAEPHLYGRNSWDEYEICSNYCITITRNNKTFYSFSCRDLSYGIAKAQTYITELEEHPINFFSRNYIEHDIIGRKIWWHNQPAIITRYIDGQACVIVEPDGADYFTMPKSYGEDDAYFENTDVKLDIIADKNICWFRN